MKVLVTGGNGFLGKHVKKSFNKCNYLNIIYPTSKECNLLCPNSVNDYFAKELPDIVLHMAAICGGIGANIKSPANFIHLNNKMTCNLFDAISKYKISYVYTLGSVCAYPSNCPVPFKEDDLWNGFPEISNSPYGTAKRNLLVTHQAFMNQYGIRGAHLIPVNLYGEYDNFSLESSHVIPALINKFYTAKLENIKEVVCWGTGSATREFLYAGDAAEAITKSVIQNFNSIEPINIGTGIDISVSALSQKIADIIGYTGSIIWDTSKPDGQAKRRLDVSRAKQKLGFVAKTSLDFGLRNTIDWYIKNYLE